MGVREIWFGRTPLSRIARVLLLPASALYWLGWKGYLLVYRLGIKSPYRPRIPVVVFGNFTVGGSGKSPAAMAAARALMGKGWSVAIGCSGYGSPRSEGAAWAPEGALDAAVWGDEPAMIRDALPEVPLVVGRRRVLAARLVEERFPGAILVMDDGLQHLPLAADLRIALDDPGADNRFVLPAGPYREPLSPDRFDLKIPGRFRLERRIEGFSLPDGTPAPPGAPEVYALAALARPERFFAALQDLGLPIRRSRALPDHDPLTEGTLLDSFEPEIPLVVTAKDWVKLRARNDLQGRTIWIAREAATIEPAQEFADWLHATAQEIAETKARR